MPSFNKVILVGNLTRDIEQRYTPKGTCVGAGGLAVNRKWTSDSGEEKEEVTFVDFQSFGRTAEVLCQYVRKGDPIFLEGRLKYESWDDKQTNQKRSKLVVIVESFQFLAYHGDDKGGGQRQQPARTETKTLRQQAKENAEAETPQVDDDVPF